MDITNFLTVTGTVLGMAFMAVLAVGPFLLNLLPDPKDELDELTPVTHLSRRDDEHMLAA